MSADNTLFVIPARGGSKGIPGKNIKLLDGKPLIYYSIDVARSFTSDDNICVTTDSDSIISVVEEYNLPVPFKRPPTLATDESGIYEALLHALDYYKSKGKTYDNMVLLQPTSPFRTATQVKNAFELYDNSFDMVVSVHESKFNPYFNLFEEENGLLRKSKPGTYVRRQDCPPVYAYNGAIYIINIKSLLNQPISSFQKIKKFIMDDESSLDLDNPVDWLIAETLIKKRGI